MDSESALPEKVRLVSVVDPSIDLRNPRYAVLEAPQTVSWAQYPASSVAPGAISISANVPSNTIVDRYMLLQINAHFEFKGSNPGGGATLLNFDATDALRFWPIASVTNSLTMKIAGKSVSVGVVDSLFPQGVLRYHNDVLNQDGAASLTPSMPDGSQNYVDLLGSVRNPLAGYASGSDVQCPRGAWTKSQVTNLVNVANATTASFDVVLQEPLLMSPFLWSGEADNEPGIYSVETYNFQMTFDPLSRMWSRINPSAGPQIDPTNPAHGITVTFNGASLLLRQITPNPLTPIPKSMSYSYFNPVLYQQGGTASAAYNVPVDISSSVISLPGIPRRLYIFVGERQSDRTFLTTDSFFSIDSINLMWGTNQYLREATPVQLWRIAQKNGCDLSWPQWSYFVGGVLCLDLGSDVGLKAGEAAGAEGRFQFQIRYQGRNLNQSRSVWPTLNVVAVQEGLVHVGSTGTVTIIENPLSVGDVVQAEKKVPGISYKRSESVYGGGLVAGMPYGDLRREAKGGFAPGAAAAAALPFLQALGSSGKEAFDKYYCGEPAAKPRAMKAPKRSAIRRAMRGRGVSFAEEDDEEQDEEEQGSEISEEEDPVEMLLRGRR